METQVPSPLSPRPKLTIHQKPYHHLELTHPSNNNNKTYTIQTPKFQLSSASHTPTNHLLLIFLQKTNQFSYKLVLYKLPFPFPTHFPTSFSLQNHHSREIERCTTNLPIKVKPLQILILPVLQRQEKAMILVFCRSNYYQMLFSPEDNVPMKISEIKTLPKTRNDVPLLPEFATPWMVSNRSAILKTNNNADCEIDEFLGDVIISDAAGVLWLAPIPPNRNYDFFQNDATFCSTKQWRSLGSLEELPARLVVRGEFVVMFGMFGRCMVLRSRKERDFGRGEKWEVRRFWSGGDVMETGVEALEDGSGVTVGGRRVSFVNIGNDEGDGYEVSVEGGMLGSREERAREMKSVLRGIDHAGYWNSIVDGWSKGWEEQVKGLSMAMLQKLNVDGAKLEVQVSCVPKRRNLEWAGGNVDTCVDVTNNGGMQLGEGWGLQVGIKQRLRKIVDCSYAELQNLTPGKGQKCLFPFTLYSHSPVEVDVTVVYHNTSCRPEENRPVLRILQTIASLDVLDCSEKCPNGASFVALSQYRLPLNRLNEALCNSVANSSSIETFRLRVGVAASNLEAITGSWRTALGGQVVIETVARGDVKTTIIVRSPKHIVPFARAAVLRRLLRADVDFVQQQEDESTVDAIAEGRRAVLRSTSNLVESLRILHIDPRSGKRSVEWTPLAMDALKGLERNVFDSHDAWRRCTSTL